MLGLEDRVSWLRASTYCISALAEAAPTAPCRTRPEQQLMSPLWLCLPLTQVRGLAVCAAWRRYLDVRAWPLEALFIDVIDDEFGRPFVEWIIRRQPAIRSFGLSAHALDPLASSALLSLNPGEVRCAEGRGAVGLLLRAVCREAWAPVSAGAGERSRCLACLLHPTLDSALPLSPPAL